MSKRFTIQDLQKSKVAANNTGVIKQAATALKHKRKQAGSSARSTALDWLELNIAYWCNENSLLLEKEVRVDALRKFRFDFAIQSQKIAIEFEGGIFLKEGGHNTAKHYNKDTDKYNLALVNEWKVIRVTAINYKSVIEILNKLIKREL